MIDPRILIACAALVVSFAGGWLVHGWKYDAEQLELQQQVIAAKDANDKLKTELGVKHAAESKVIAGLSDELRTLRLRLPKGCVKPNTPTGGADSATGGGELPTEAQAAFDRFNGELARLTRDADEIVSACRVVMEWAKVQGAVP